MAPLPSLVMVSVHRPRVHAPSYGDGVALGNTIVLLLVAYQQTGSQFKGGVVIRIVQQTHKNMHYCIYASIIQTFICIEARAAHRKPNEGLERSLIVDGLHQASLSFGSHSLSKMLQ